MAIIAAGATIATAGIGVYADRERSSEKIEALEQKLKDAILERDDARAKLAAAAISPNSIEVGNAYQGLPLAPEVCVSRLKAAFREEDASLLSEGKESVDYYLNGDHLSLWCADNRVIIATASMKSTARATQQAASSILAAIANADAAATGTPN